MSGTNPDNERESIADRVVTDPGSPPDVNVVVGWIGKSGQEGVVRIYLRFDFTAYIEVPESDVVYIRHTNTDLEFSIVWVKWTARLQIVESDVDVVRAWKDRDYRDRLTEAQRERVPQHPSGSTEVPSVLSGGVVVGTPLVCTPSSTFAWSCCPVKIAIAAAPDEQ